MHEYLLKFWGQGQERVARALKTSQTNFWFDTKEEREDFKKKVKKAAKDHMLAFSEEEGPYVRYRTVALVTVEFKGQEYSFEYDFGFGYPEESAYYMFEDGNYSCNCNLSGFIRDDHPEFPELDCLGDEEGNEIELVSLKVVFR